MKALDGRPSLDTKSQIPSSHLWSDELTVKFKPARLSQREKRRLMRLEQMKIDEPAVEVSVGHR